MMYNLVSLQITFLEDLWNMFVNMLPGIVGAIVALIIGWIAGRALGMGVSKILDKAGVDDALRKTVIGKAIEKSGITCVHFFDLIVRWFIYLIAILAAASILDIAVLSDFLNTVVSYVPSFIAGVFILLFGFIIVDYFADFFRTFGREAKIEFTGIMANGLRLILYFVIIVISLSVIGIDITILYIFATALAWGIAVGAGVGLAIAVGWGFKDVVRTKADEWIKTATEAAKKAEETAEK
jgi:small-conductance mechanosensitive channel